MKSFEQRKSKGQELENYVVKYLKDNKIGYFLTGYEKLIEKNDAKIKIIKSNSNTSFFVRHYPDITVCSEKNSCLLEIKNSSGIEKNCWENYWKLYQNLQLNVFFVLKNKLVYNITGIHFKKHSGYDYKAKMHVPVTDGIWLEPRLLDKHKYNQYKKAFQNKTSGCSFAFIDFEKSKGYPINILNKLK